LGETSFLAETLYHKGLVPHFSFLTLQTGFTRKEKQMKKYTCIPCGYVYDPELGDSDGGIAEGTPFEELPDDWHCPICFVGKDEFEPTEE